MTLAQFVIRDAIRPILSGTNREQVVRELVDSLVSCGSLTEADREDVVKAVLRRESLGSTGIGKNVAIPHSRHASASQLVCAVGLSAQGIPFDSIDGEAVNLFFLLVSPHDRPTDHLRALETVVKVTNDDTYLNNLKSSKTADEIWEAIQNPPAA
jgi:mannitol/fructose-specific phosphotransferase system IIA component (Ntr-type)